MNSKIGRGTLEDASGEHSTDTRPLTSRTKGRLLLEEDEALARIIAMEEDERIARKLQADYDAGIQGVDVFHSRPPSSRRTSTKDEAFFLKDDRPTDEALEEALLGMLRRGHDNDHATENVEPVGRIDQAAEHGGQGSYPIVSANDKPQQQQLALDGHLGLALQDTAHRTEPAIRQHGSTMQAIQNSVTKRGQQQPDGRQSAEPRSAIQQHTVGVAYQPTEPSQPLVDQLANMPPELSSVDVSRLDADGNIAHQQHEMHPLPAAHAGVTDEPRLDQQHDPTPPSSVTQAAEVGRALDPTPATLQPYSRGTATDAEMTTKLKTGNDGQDEPAVHPFPPESNQPGGPVDIGKLINEPPLEHNDLDRRQSCTDHQYDEHNMARTLDHPDSPTPQSDVSFDALSGSPVRLPSPSPPPQTQPSPPHSKHPPESGAVERKVQPSSPVVAAQSHSKRDPLHSSAQSMPQHRPSPPLPRASAIATNALRARTEESFRSVDDHPRMDEDTMHLMELIAAYQPEDVGLSPVLKCFLPDLIPTVGDIDPFVKVPAPPHGLGGDLTAAAKMPPRIPGLQVLDEPGTQQSDPAAVDLAMRMFSLGNRPENAAAVRSIQGGSGSSISKLIDRWIGNVHAVQEQARQSRAMLTDKPVCDVELLMAEWPGPLAEHFSNKNIALPTADIDLSLLQLAQLYCNLVDIPVIHPGVPRFPAFWQ